MLVGIEHILLASAKVGVDLTGEKSVLRDVCVPRIFIEGQ